MDKQLSLTLYRWAKNNQANRASLQTWLDEAIAEIASGKGNQITSSSGNGVSVTFSVGMTYANWANTISQALGYLDSGTASTKTVGRIS